MLEAHGEAARAKAWELLSASVNEANTTVDPFFQMNLVAVLRVIPRPAAASVQQEVDVVVRTLGRDSPPPLVKQVIGYLALLRHEKSERALITYLRVFENMLLQPETAVYSPPDIEVLLDRTCIALTRYGTPRAWRALVHHGLKAEHRLGSPMVRLGEVVRQAIRQSQLTGVLSLMRLPGKVEASLLLEGGRFRGAQFAALAGEEAVYELFEKPFPGTFAFVSRSDITTQGATVEALDVVGLLLEGVRRHDEFKRAAALVPDQAVLEPTGPPSPQLPGEPHAFLRAAGPPATHPTPPARPH